MSAGSREVEIKLRFESPALALSALERIGVRRETPRRFEDNALFDIPPGVLRRRGELLRLRRVGDETIVTLKRPVPGTHEHKVREEIECHVADGQVLEAVIGALGALPLYRYQKYRTEFRLGELHVLLDETPIGCFVELEGPPEQIDATAAELGFSKSDYIRETYHRLHELAAERHGERRGDMLMPRDDAP